MATAVLESLAVPRGSYGARVSCISRSASAPIPAALGCWQADLMVEFKGLRVANRPRKITSARRQASGRVSPRVAVVCEAQNTTLDDGNKNSCYVEAMSGISNSVSHPRLAVAATAASKASAFRPSSVSLLVSSSLSSKRPKLVAMAALEAAGSMVSADSLVAKLPSHPTYDLKAVIALALAEDAGDRGDVTSLATLPYEMEVEAHFIAKEDGVIAGISLAEMIFDQVDPSLKVEWSVRDGNYVTKGMRFGKVYGCAHNIVVAERVVLNFMQRMSGIATLTKVMADTAYPAYILETRKTAPGLRLVDKWAVLIGGGRNHRMGLFDMIMIKDNHISIVGGVANALESVDSFLKERNLKMPVEVETRTLEEVKEVLNYASQTRCSLTRIMLDNMVIPLPNGDVDVTMLQNAVEMIDGRFETEASGNVSLETVKKIGETGVTYISSGALTHSVKALDISLKIDTELALQVARRTNRA